MKVEGIWFVQSYFYLCQSWGWGRVWDRRGSCYRLWRFIHFTFFCGSALGWCCQPKERNLINIKNIAVNLTLLMGTCFVLKT